MELCLQPEGCGLCGAPLPKGRRRWCSDSHRMAWYVDHVWRYARHAAMRRTKRRCVGCGEWAVEVDHIIPRLGVPLHRHSCLHHQENLRPLCHRCHRDRKGGLLGGVHLTVNAKKPRLPLH